MAAHASVPALQESERESLGEMERAALAKLRATIQKFMASSNTSTAATATAAPTADDEFSIWGVPLLNDSRSDAVLLKFLRAQKFKPKESLDMIKKALKWRRDLKIDKVLEEDLDLPQMDSVLFLDGVSRTGKPVCYNVYKTVLSDLYYDKDKRVRLRMWRIQFAERTMRRLFSNDHSGIRKILQVVDFNRTPAYFAIEELREPLEYLRAYYPDIVDDKVFINVPWRYSTFIRVARRFSSEKTDHKSVLAAPRNSTEKLFKYVAPQQVPVQFNGMKQKCSPNFTLNDIVNEVDVEPKSKPSIDMAVTKECTVVVELRVIDWDVNAEISFIAVNSSSLQMIRTSHRINVEDEEPIATYMFKVAEAGTVRVTIDNSSSKKKKKAFYRFKELQVPEEGGKNYFLKFFQ